MATLKDEAQNFIPSKAKNVSELGEISVDAEIKSFEGTDETGKSYKYKYLEINGEKYRIPNMVIGQVKDIIEANPITKRFKVKKTGEGKATRYTVIQLN